MQPTKQHARQTSCRCLLSNRDPDELRSTMLHTTIGASLSATERYVSTKSREEIEEALGIDQDDTPENAVKKISKPKPKKSKKKK